MGKSLLLVFAASLFFVSCTCSRKSADKEAEEQIHKRSYYLGVGLGRSVDKSQDYDEDDVIRGFKDAINGAEGLPSTEELQKFFLAEQQRKFQKQNAEQFQKEQAASKFIEDAVKKEQLFIAREGVYYKELNPGSGTPPNASDKIIVKYKGFLPDGSIFEDQSKKAVTMKVLEAPIGWRASLDHFRKGSKLKLYLSPQNAFGMRGHGKVPPMSAVVYEVEVIDIVRSQEKKIRL